ncbi:MAG: redoxin domain-containing protein [Verrucomicrobiota bacterium]
MRYLPLLLLLPILSCSKPELTEFTEDFESAISPAWSKQNISITEDGDRRYLGPFGFEEVVLDLENLAPHRQITVEFDLYLFRSWNGNNTREGMDIFTVMLGDGRILHRTNFSQRFSKQTQAFPGFYPLHRMPSRTGAMESNTLGSSFKGKPSSSVYRLTRTFPHDAKDLQLIIQGSSDDDIDNEAWGIDNVSIRLHDKPPSSLAITPAEIESAFTSDDGSIADDMVDILVQSPEAAVPELLKILADSSRPVLADELLFPHSLFYHLPHDPKTKEPLPLNPDQRKHCLTAFTLQLIGTESARLAVANWQSTDDLRRIPLTLSDEAGNPARHVGVRVYSDRGHSWFTHADREGNVLLKMPAEDPRHFRIVINSKTYVYDRYFWERVSGDPMPDKIALITHLPVTIGGEVLDNNGAPIADAKVFVHPKINEDGELKRVVDYGNSVQTDENGKWTFDGCHPKAAEVDIAVYHPQFVSTGDGFHQYEKHKDISSLKSKTAVAILDRGYPLTVTITDSSKKPLVNAKVFMGRSNVASNALPWHQTDENGSIQLAAEAGKTITVTAKTDGFAPELIRFQMPESDHQVTIPLSPAFELTGKIIDSSGNGIPGVTVFMDTWRGSRTLNVRFKTDAEGKFRWEEAPADVVQADIYKRGFTDSRNTPIQAGQENIITLYPPTVFRGTVLDEITGKPVQKFEVHRGILWENSDRPHWNDNPHTHTSTAPGRFETQLTYPYPGNLIRVSAPGYMPAESERFAMRGQRQEHVFHLRPVDQLEFSILDHSEQPVPNAIVATISPQQSIFLNGFEMEESRMRGMKIIRSDASGTARITPPSEEYLVMVLHESGVGISLQDKLMANQTMKLHPYGSLTGTAYRGKEKVTDGKVGIYWDWRKHFNIDDPQHDYGLHFSQQASTDHNGKFKFDTVPAGTVSLGQYVSSFGGSNSCTYTTKVQISAGKVVDTKLGGDGSLVTGSITIPDSIKERNWKFSFSQLRQIPTVERPSVPDELQKGTLAMEEWSKSEARKKFEEKQQKWIEAMRNVISYSVVFENASSFRIDDVKPGKYSLNINIHEAPEGNVCGYGDQLGSFTTEVEVPDSEDTPIKLGELKVIAKEQLRIGDAAPEFSVQTLTGEHLSLSNLSGKYILLDFWATWCGPCVAETPNLKEAYELFGDRQDFVLIGLSSDQSDAPLVSYIEKNNLEWHNARPKSQTISQSYHVNGIPSIWLIGPEGEIVAKNLRGSQIVQTLRKYLK